MNNINYISTLLTFFFHFLLNMKPVHIVIFKIYSHVLDNSIFFIYSKSLHWNNYLTCSTWALIRVTFLSTCLYYFRKRISFTFFYDFYMWRSECEYHSKLKDQVMTFIWKLYLKIFLWIVIEESLLVDVIFCNYLIKWNKFKFSNEGKVKRRLTPRQRQPAKATIDISPKSTHKKSHLSQWLVPFSFFKKYLILNLKLR